MEPLDRAAREMREQNYGSAIRSLELLTAQDPANAEAQKLLAQAYYRTRDLQKAADAAQRYAGLRPTDPGGHYNAGVVLMELGQREAAERAFRAALAADPGHAKARRALHKLAEEPPPPAPVTPRASAPEKRGMPWQAKAAAALTVLAAAAIILALFLPGGRALRGRQSHAPEDDPAAVTTPPPEQPSAVTPAPTASPLPTQPQASQTQPADLPPMPETKKVEDARPAAEQMWRNVWAPWTSPQRVTQTQGTGQEKAGGPSLPVPDDLLARLEGRAAPPAPAWPSAETGPSDEGKGRAPTGRTGPQLRDIPPTAQPGQGPPPARQAPAAPQPLFSPREAERIARDMDRVEKQAVQYTLRLFANWLRYDGACNDEGFWPILQALLAETLSGMVLPVLTDGLRDLASLILNAPSAQDAANSLEQYAARVDHVIPPQVIADIAYALAVSMSPDAAYSNVDYVLRYRGVQLSDYSTQVLIDAINKATAQRERMQQRGR